MKKRITSMLLAFLMVLSTVSATTAAATDDGVQPQGIVYPFFCTYCNSSSYYITSTWMDFDPESSVTCTHHGTKDYTAYKYAELTCSECRHTRSNIITDTGIYCVKDGRFYF